MIQGNNGFKVIPHIVFSLFTGTKLVSICRHCAGTLDGPVCYCDSGEQWVLGHPSYHFSLFPGTKLVSICRHCAGTIDGPVCYCDSGEQWVLGHPSYHFSLISIHM